MQKAIHNREPRKNASSLSETHACTFVDYKKEQVKQNQLKRTHGGKDS